MVSSARCVECFVSSVIIDHHSFLGRATEIFSLKLLYRSLGVKSGSSVTCVRALNPFIFQCLNNYFQKEYNFVFTPEPDISL
jgi:hypothetical protein